MGQEDLGGNLLTLCNLSAGDEALLKIIGDLFLKVPVGAQLVLDE
jgi:hypothetical protein